MFRVLRMEAPNRKLRWLFGGGVAAGALFLLSGRLAVEHTSGDQFCDRACHAHQQATQLWIKSTHFTNKSGVITHCTECHLPAGSSVDGYLQKTRLGVQDVYGKLFKDAAAIDWQSKGLLDRARTFIGALAAVGAGTLLSNCGWDTKHRKPLPPRAIFRRRLRGWCRRKISTR